MAVRLSKIAREFNVGLSTIVEFLHSKGIKISSDPNAKLTDEDYALVAKEFSSDSQVKKESSLVDLKNTRKKKETVTIDNAGNISSGNENTEEEEEEFISIKDEVRFENKIKIVDHIDLNPEKKTQPEPVEAKVEQPKRETQEEITEKVEEPKVTRVEVELVYQELKRVEAYTKRIENAMEKGSQLEMSIEELIKTLKEESKKREEYYILKRGILLTQILLLGFLILIAIYKFWF